jgi:hypothetical protein
MSSHYVIYVLGTESGDIMVWNMMLSSWAMVEIKLEGRMR